MSSFTKGCSTAAKRTNVPFVFQEPAEDIATAPKDWLQQEVYTANEGCIAVFIERGRLEGMSGQYPDSSQSSRCSKSNPIPIRLTSFLCLGGDHGFPYIFEFRNVERDTSDAIQSRAENEVGYDTDDYASESSRSTSSSSRRSNNGETSDITNDAEPEVDVGESEDSDEPLSPSKRRRKQCDARVQHRHTVRRTNQSKKVSQARRDRSAQGARSQGVFASFTCHEQDDEEVIPEDQRWRFKLDTKLKKERTSAASMIAKAFDDPGAHA